MCACEHVNVLPHHGSAADMLDQSLIGFHAPETLNPVTQRERLERGVCVCVYECVAVVSLL